MPLGPRRGDVVVGILDDDDRPAIGLDAGRNDATDLAIADQNRVVGLVRGLPGIVVGARGPAIDRRLTGASVVTGPLAAMTGSRRAASDTTGASASRPRNERASSRGLTRSSTKNTTGLRTMEISAPARIRSCPSGGRMASDTPMLARMNENSPICASDAEMVSAVPTGRLKRITIQNAASDLPMTMMNTVASTRKAG